MSYLQSISAAVNPHVLPDPMTGVLVMVPTYCEVENIEPLVRGLFAVIPESTVLIIDDDSPDGTAKAARKLECAPWERLVVLSRPKKTGVGSALKEGFQYGIEHGFSFFIQMDADLSHEPATIPALLEAAKDADIAVGSRLVEGSEVSGRLPIRSLMTRFASRICKNRFQVSVRDTSSGFKCWTRQAVELVKPWEMASNSYAFQMECNITATRLKLRTVEVPIRFCERFTGKSKADGREIFNSVRDVVAMFRRKRQPTQTPHD